MRAARAYEGEHILKLEEVERPTPGSGDAVIEVKSACLAPGVTRISAVDTASTAEQVANSSAHLTRSSAQDGRLQVDDLITHRFSLADIADAERLVRERYEPAWMVVINP
jgi:threonine dehydrogenase-like Zn-dependent dehydrogenase